LDGFGGFSGWGSKQRHGLPPSSEVGLAWKMQAQDAFAVGFMLHLWSVDGLLTVGDMGRVIGFVADGLILDWFGRNLVGFFGSQLIFGWEFWSGFLLQFWLVYLVRGNSV
jgi:hypothetical protein